MYTDCVANWFGPTTDFFGSGSSWVCFRNRLVSDVLCNSPRLPGCLPLLSVFTGSASACEKSICVRLSFSLLAVGRSSVQVQRIPDIGLPLSAFLPLPEVACFFPPP